VVFKVALLPVEESITFSLKRVLPRLSLFLARSRVSTLEPLSTLSLLVSHSSCPPVPPLYLPTSLSVQYRVLTLSAEGWLPPTCERAVSHRDGLIRPRPSRSQVHHRSGTLRFYGVYIVPGDGIVSVNHLSAVKEIEPQPAGPPSSLSLNRNDYFDYFYFVCQRTTAVLVSESLDYIRSTEIETLQWHRILNCGPYSKIQGTDLYSATNQVYLTDVMIDQVIPRLARHILVYGCCLRVRSSV
jgi:hypothetical protein